MLDIEQLLMTGVEIGTNLWVDATGTFAFLASIQVASVHAVHVGRRSAEVGEVAFEVGQVF